MSKSGSILSTMAAVALGCAAATSPADATALGPKAGVYQVRVHQSCPNGSCQMTFAQVPAGKVLQVARVACSIVTGGQVYAGVVESSIAADAPLFLRPQLVANVSTFHIQSWVVSDTVQHYFSPSSKPKITLMIDTTGNSADCTLTGLLVAP